MAPFPAFHSDPEETAEAFVMNRMRPSEAAAFKAHLVDCPDCSKKVQAAHAFVSAMHSAALDHVQKNK
jgi:hypothetical protein